MFKHTVIIFLVLSFAVAGCVRSKLQRFGWSAEEYFTDEQTKDLCKAIEQGDSSKIKQLLTSGANVNDYGKDGMTPLLWAFVGGNAEIFQLLIDSGADPTVPTKDDLKTRGEIRIGWTVAHLAANGRNEEKFHAILNSGIDPNILCQDRGGELSLMDVVLMSVDLLSLNRTHSLENKRARVQAILELGPNQSVLDQSARTAVASENFEAALMLFQAGANYKTPYSQWGNMIHDVARFGVVSHSNEEYAKLVAWLESKGQDVVAARADWERWQADIGFDPDAAAARRKKEILLRAKKEGVTVSWDE